MKSVGQTLSCDRNALLIERVEGGDDSCRAHFFRFFQAFKIFKIILLMVNISKNTCNKIFGLPGTIRFAINSLQKLGGVDLTQIGNFDLERVQNARFRSANRYVVDWISPPICVAYVFEKLHAAETVVERRRGIDCLRLILF